MTTTTTRPALSTTRKLALAAGLFYFATFVFSIPALGFYDNVLNNADFVHGAGYDGGVLWGALFEVLTALTGIATAVLLYPVIRRHSQTGAIGFVASRTLEAAAIFVGVMTLLAVYTLRQDLGATDAAGLGTAAHALVAVHDWSFLLGPGIMPAVSALFLAPALRRTGLVPRIIPTIGLVGAPLLLASTTAALFGVWEQLSGPAMVLVLPIATWELALGGWMTFKGFRSPAVVDITGTDPTPAADHVYA